MTTISYPQFASVESGLVTGSDPYLFTATGDGGVGESDTFIAADTDGKIRFTLGTFFGPVFFGLNTTDENRGVGGQDFAVGVNGGGAFQPRRLSDVLSPNGDTTLVGTVGFVVEIERAGVEIFINVYDGSVWRIVHVFDDQYTGALWPNFRTFDAGNTFAPTAELGQSRTYWIPNTVNFIEDGNSYNVRAEPKTLVQRMRFLAPFLGSGTTVTNVSIDGQTVQEMLDDHSDVDAAFDGSRDYNVLETNEVTNEIFLNSTSGVDAALLLGDLHTACKAVHSSLLIASQTTIPSQRSLPDGATLTSLNSECDAADAYMLANTSALLIDALLDMDTLPLYAGFGGVYTAATFTAAASAYYEPPPNCLHQSGDDAGAYQQLTAEARCANLMTLPIPLSYPTTGFSPGWTMNSNTVIQS